MTNYQKKKPFKLGLTGSIGMGKTSVSLEFLKFDIPVWSADDVVYSLYKKDNKGYNIVKNLVPNAVSNIEVNRDVLSKVLIEDENLLKVLEKSLHPLLELDRRQFHKKYSNQDIILYDIPLLFETDAHFWLDSVIVVTAPFSVQKKRVLSRKNMTEKKFQYILTKQMSDQEKIKKADYIINTDSDLLALQETVKKFIEMIKKIVKNT